MNQPQKTQPLRGSRLIIVTPDAILYDGAFSGAYFNGGLGAMGVMPGHEPTVVELQDGAMHFEDSQGKVHQYQITHAMAHITQHELVVHAVTAVAA